MQLPQILPISPADMKYSFHEKLREHELTLPPLGIHTLQVNITKLCNQACRHCHVDASPKRTEQMDRLTVEHCLAILAAHDEIKNLDITGGAPELNPHFEFFVTEARRLGKHVMVRHNLTVSLDPHPLTKQPMTHLPQFFADHGIEVISSLPFYEEYFTDKQRGRGVFNKSIAALKNLNALGYGKDDSGLVLNLVYNPVGTYLPAAQGALEADYKRSLHDKFGIHFNNLFTITNMPIHRFREDLERTGKYDEYMMKLINAFNPGAAQGVMCRTLISVSYDGKIYDCDFNQMLGMQSHDHEPLSVFNFDATRIRNRAILFASHCFGCTAGSGSSCGGTTA
ncbi:MAG TPA: arsenosugar biosynthesis radical SAM protein ArsS [bacterium]|nr:arsenosugar biosynthesis radical SAM protein ArsS [bacterium]HNL26247.1 arsenosugar biosynthesis radical SAM protein ArsS [bacterium]